MLKHPFDGIEYMLQGKCNRCRKISQSGRVALRFGEFRFGLNIFVQNEYRGPKIKLVSPRLASYF